MIKKFGIECFKREKEEDVTKTCLRDSSGELNYSIFILYLR